MDTILEKLIESVFTHLFEGEDLPAQMIRQLVKDGILTKDNFTKAWSEKTDGFIQRTRLGDGF